MSSDSSNRYQSKLFNFVYQHSRWLTRTLENTIKNLQVVTQLGIGSLLYPLYQLLPQNETGKQLHSITPPASDGPIQVILNIVKNLPPGDADLPISQKTNPLTFLGFLWEKIFLKRDFPTSENTLQQYIPKVQGIAIELQTRNLVLVSADNRIFDIFTPQQNAKLADRINSEVSEYQYSLRVISHQQKELLPKIDHLLNKLTSEDSMIAQKSYLHPIKPFGFLDKLVADLENTALVPAQERSQKIINNFQSQFQELGVNHDDLKSQKLQISDLMTAVINYFLGGKNNYQIKSNFVGEQPQSSNNSLDVSDSLEDNWLTWNDLFSDNQTNTGELFDDHDVSKLPQIQLKWGLPVILRKIGQKPPISENEEFLEIDSQTSQEFNFQPDWIDISATSLGYEKHPLEQILEWLDQIILWIEQILINVVYFFRGLLLGR
ncbi:hypothetical protein RI030_16195 [Aphanizomenon flos-aquae NRERC-008]|jgi:hypothetical protein|uniref:Uncharacterized protein n=1 Tax=Aphanizomenon flos-aquae FACHB-1249 TaxID=2692889 RepID=A0ABR8ITU6_APHFL|nr:MULTISPECIES: hypothetical protein [Aphanizomenon]MBD2391166.1 hypothetical protein [Aphanizomenon flos-aquae FACHB-1171]MBD2556505.1 hypothetical protein [Aphanizomenon flos-aquae FACHB-1290]MBD2632118.1 hypothetical protein [Aphanizomenon sp. FACHB-1399]MBD2642913.1 hypothetical protein [Aphanizomenon sp. FACHB-1401]MBD2657821.1 hypothetical protein [Aphanizomenon flos-aquae FACHB-1265]